MGLKRLSPVIRLPALDLFVTRLEAPLHPPAPSRGFAQEESRPIKYDIRNSPGLGGPVNFLHAPLLRAGDTPCRR